MKFWIVLLATVLAASACQPKAEPAKNAPVAESGEPVLLSRAIFHPYPDAVSVKLFVSNGHNKSGDRTYIDKRGRRLSAQERSDVEVTFLKSTYAPSESGRAFPACCVPHHFFRYYDKSGKQVGEVAICFCCLCIETRAEANFTENEFLHFDAARLKALIAKMGLPTNIDCDA